MFEVFVLTLHGITVGVSQGLHGHDGPGTTVQFIPVFDGDARSFGDSSYSRTAGFVSFSISAAGTRGTYECCFHSERVIHLEDLI